MPDITLCDNDKCRNSSKCYRFRAVPYKDWQSFSHWRPDHKGKCNAYMPLRVIPKRISKSTKRRLTIQSTSLLNKRGLLKGKKQ